MQKLGRINSRCILEIIPHIREQVEYVEKLRNAGTDVKLRYNYNNRLIDEFSMILVFVVFTGIH